MGAIAKRIEDLSAAFGRLSRREKFMVSGLAITFVLFVGLLVSWLVGSSLSGLEKRIASKTEHLETIIGMRQEYEKAMAGQQQAKDRLKRDKKLQLMGTLENLAKQLGIDTNELQMNPRPAVANAESGVEEKVVGVKIKKITIDRLVDFLERIEGRSESVKIRKLKIGKNFREPTHLDAEFTVSKFELLEAAVADKTGPGKTEEPKTDKR